MEENKKPEEEQNQEAVSQQQENPESKSEQYIGEYGNPISRTEEPNDVGSDAQNQTYGRAESQTSDQNQTYGQYGQTSGTYRYSGSDINQDARYSGSDTNHDTRYSGNPGGGYYQRKMQENNNMKDNYNGSNDGKKPASSSGKKILVAAACAIVFGVVGGLCFQATRLATNDFVASKTQSNNNGNTIINKGTTQASTTNAVSGGAISSNVIGVVNDTMPSIVAITSTTKASNYYDLFGQEYAGQESTSAGSGFIIGENDNELLVATNNHVIEDAKTISVQFIDEEICEATVKGTDSSKDLAVVAVKKSDIKDTTKDKIKIAQLGDSENLQVGEMVVAIGNALGYGQSVTVGYVSAKDREVTTSDSSDYFSSGDTSTITCIQTDAAINPGNSGGALINMQGQVVGINSAKIASSQVEGIGYAIPITTADIILKDLMTKEKLGDSEKGFLGITGKTISSQMEKAYNIPAGVLVSEVNKGEAAEKAGIQKGDVITKVNDYTVSSINALREKVNSIKKGTKVTITYQRSDNGEYKEHTAEVTLQGSSDTSGDVSESEQKNDDTDMNPFSKDDKDNNDNNDNNNNNDNNDDNGGIEEEPDENQNPFGDFFNDFFGY